MCRVVAACGLTQRLGAQLASGLQIEGRVGAKLMLSRLSIVPVAHGPGFHARRLNDQVQAGQQGVWNLPPDRVWPHGLDTYCCEFWQVSALLLPRVTPASRPLCQK